MLFAGLENVDLARWSAAAEQSYAAPKSEACRVLLRAGAGDGAAALELAIGKGSVIVCSFDLIERAKDDPVSRILLANMLTSLASPRKRDAAK
jgi:hypothetical protein